MHPTLSLADSAISLSSSEMSPLPSSTLDPASRLSNLSAHLKDTPSLTPAQQTLLDYHLSALESVLAPSSGVPSTAPLPPSKQAVPISPPPSASYAAPSKPAPLEKQRQGGPDGLLESLTTLTSSLRTRHSETQNLHSLLLLKLSTLSKRIHELEERIRELYVLLFGFLGGV